MTVTRSLRYRSACLLALMLSLGCGGGPPVPADDTAGIPAARQEATAEEQEAAASAALTIDYLVGEWCSGEMDRPARTTWIFDQNGSVRWGRQSSLAEGPDVDTFVSSGTLVSSSADQFVMSQAGTEVRFTRGTCPAPRPAQGGP